VKDGRDSRPDLLRWAQRLQAMAQIGLTFTRDAFDRERYEELREIALEMAAASTAAPLETVRPVFAGSLGYPTPKVDVRAVVFRGDELLLVREARTGRWTFPGGWADLGDTPGEAAVRETLEESGYRVRARKLLALLDKSRQGHPASIDYAYKVLIDCELLGGEAVTSHETDAVGFFPRGALPALDTHRTTPGQVELAWAHRLDPARPTDFD
jgi:ADP-ribose pyrophosphatase YjhB (NUDIX family)